MEYKIDDGVRDKQKDSAMMEGHPPFSSSQRLLSCIVKGIRDPSAEGEKLVINLTYLSCI